MSGIQQDQNIEQQIQFEKIASKTLLPFLFILLAIIISIFIFMPEILRQVSGLTG